MGFNLSDFPKHVQNQVREKTEPKKRKNYKAIGSMPVGEMNKTEQAYANYLDLLIKEGSILFYQFEVVKFRLAKATFYTPDFIIMKADRSLLAVDVKGVWRDDARVKIKVAAEHIYWLQWAGAMRDGGAWTHEYF